MNSIECFNDFNVPKWFDFQILSIPRASSMSSEILEWIIKIDSFNIWYTDDLADKQPTNQVLEGKFLFSVV